jgi:hypothetical protein
VIAEVSQGLNDIGYACPDQNWSGRPGSRQLRLGTGGETGRGDRFRPVRTTGEIEWTETVG